LEASNASADLVSNACLERDRARKAARQAIASKEFASFGRDARSVAADDSRQNLRQFGAAALTRAQRKLMKRARGIDWRDAGERHAMRIRIKRLRYSCEFFATAFAARRAAPYIAALKALQEILGELNDIAVGRRLLGFDADETALLRKLAPAWAALAKRPVFWRAAG
ncbi:MAG: CHAD domain-containing protein, partial [Burkholderiales bacterium]